MNYLQWPIRARPVIHQAGLFPLNARKFDYVYRSASHAIHLHEYTGTIRLAGEDHPLVPGTLTLSPAHQDSSYDLPRPGVHWCIHFDTKSVRSKALSIKLPLLVQLGSASGDAAARFSHITRLRSLMAGAPDNAPALREALAVTLQGLLMWIATFPLLDSQQPAAPSNQLIERLLRFIDRNISRKITADELAQEAGLSQNYLARHFRHRVGSSLPSYILGRRIDLAQLLLKTTNLPVKQIGLRVGMPDPHHFNKQFRAFAGKSPRRFRAQNC